MITRQFVGWALALQKQNTQGEECLFSVHELNTLTLCLRSAPEWQQKQERQAKSSLAFLSL